MVVKKTEIGQTIEAKSKMNMTEQNQSSAKRWRYLAEHLNLTSKPSVVDIGANPLDAPPYKPLLDAGLCTVFGFEPQSDAFAKLQENKGTLETYENCAVGDGGEYDFNIYQGSGLSSLFKLDHQSIDFLSRRQRPASLIEQTKIKTRRLDDIDNLNHIDLLKIDVQGAEAMIFKNGPEKLSRTVAVITELRFYPLYEGEPLLDAQISELSSLGFRFHKFLFIKNQMISNSQSERLIKRRIGSQSLDGDAVFVRDLRDPKLLTTEQLKSLTLLSDAVFGSFDLTLHCLDQLVSRNEIDKKIPSEYIDLLPSELRKRV